MRLCAGMLRRWDDSQKYLSDNPHLVCEETANYLVIMCIDLEVEEVHTPFFFCPPFCLCSCLSTCLSVALTQAPTVVKMISEELLRWDEVFPMATTGYHGYQSLLEELIK